LQPREPLGVQLAAAGALAGYSDAKIAETLLERWTEYAPELRSEVTRVLLSREKWTESLLRAVEQQAVPTAALDAAQRALLLEHRNPALRDAAKKLFGGDAPNPRKQVLADYAPVLQMKGDPAAGLKIFERECLGCHKIGDKGYATGPSLVASSFRDPAALLANILDPNQYVLPNYVQYVIVDQNGRTFTGLVASQSAGSVTLKRDKDATDTILRSQIDQMAATGKSLMPEGIEKKIAPQEMADLIAYIAAAQAAEPGTGPRLDIGTEPGLVEPGR
jgi:putative heme-binding domain-containing protein